MTAPERHASLSDDLRWWAKQIETRSLAPSMAWERGLMDLLTKAADQLDRLGSARPAATWQPIETCPHDGFFLVYQDGAIRAMFRTRGEWGATGVAVDEFGDSRTDLHVVERTMFAPTHWMPLPDPPLARPSIAED